MNTDLNIATAAVETLVVQDTSTINNLFNHARVYSKGAVVLHMLRQVLGDSVVLGMQERRAQSIS